MHTQCRKVSKYVLCQMAPFLGDLSSFHGDTETQKMAFKQFITLLKNIWDLFCTLLLSSAHIPDKKLKNKHIFHSQCASDGSSNISLKGTIQTFIFKCHYLEILVSDKKCNISVTHYFGFKNPFCLYDIILNWHKGIVACIPPHAKEWQ